jgi:hypothetical protein
MRALKSGPAQTGAVSGSVSPAPLAPGAPVAGSRGSTGGLGGPLGRLRCSRRRHAGGGGAVLASRRAPRARRRAPPTRAAHKPPPLPPAPACRHLQVRRAAPVLPPRAAGGRGRRAAPAPAPRPRAPRPAAAPAALPATAAAAAAPAALLAAAAAAHAPLAMVNVDFASPSLVLGAALIGCGIVLLQARNLQRRVSRDADIVVAAMVSIVGSTLIFQGWRLDPLLLLCQALTTSVAVWYGLETFRLRAQVMAEDEVRRARRPGRGAGEGRGWEARWGRGRWRGVPQQPRVRLTPARAPRAPRAQEEMAQLPPPADPYYSQQQPGAADYARRAGSAMGPASGYLPPAGERAPAPWEAQQPGAAGAPPPGQQWAGRYPEAETVAYDYYGNPLPQPGAAPGGGGDGGGYGPPEDYASIAAAGAAAGAAAAAGGAGPSGQGYYDAAAAGQQPAGGYGEGAYYPGGGGYAGEGDAGYGPPPPGQAGPPAPQQQQPGYGGGGGYGRAPARRPAREYDAIDDWQ